MDWIDIHMLRDADESPLEEAGVLYWMRRMSAGKPVPRLLAMKQGNDRYVVVDGRKRLEAARRLGVDSIGVYLIEELPPDRFLQLRREINQRQGECN
jgi:hypothetical protein